MRRDIVRRAEGLALVLMGIVPVLLHAEKIDEIPFVPLSPELMGRGGCAIATAQGFDALFQNPAGFSRGDGVFTLTSTSSWMYAQPGQLAAEAVRLALGDTSSTDTFNFVSSQVTSGGFGAGSSIAVGYVANGLGLGSALIVDSLLTGPTMLGSTGNLTATLGFIGGLSVPIHLTGVVVHVGGDVRPMIRVHVPISNATAIAVVDAIAGGGNLGAALSSATAVYGAGLGIDMGVIAELGWFSVGLSVRDAGGTSFVYSSSPFGAVTRRLSGQGSLPSGSPVTDTYVIPMDLGVGFAFHPDLGSFRQVVDPSLSLDVRNLNGAWEGTATFWTLLHLGAEIRLLDHFTLRGGINQGYLCAGAGARIYVLDLNMAVFTRELGLFPGEQPNAGMTFGADVAF